MIQRRLWTCGRCRTDNLARSDTCRRCGAPRAGARAGGSPGFAALLSGLIPGLGQIYQDRALRGVLMVLIPAFVLTLAGAFIFIADPLTRFAVRNASLVALVVVGGIFAFHVVTVADAFAGRLGELRGRHVFDYLVLAAVTLALIGVYGTVYRSGSAWADLAAKVFEPVARALPVSVDESPPPQWSGSDRLNVLLLGIDRRGRVSETENTDTVIVLSLDPLNRTAAMLSIPRDTLVTIPGHGANKVNAAYSLGGAERGPDLARRTVEELLGIPIHSHALIDFDAFTRTVDAFGGVLVDVKRPLRDEEYPTADFGIERVHLLPGPQFMGGEVALKYARSRHDSNDFSRARRQQEVLGALRTRLAQVGVGRIPAIIDKVGNTIETSFDPANILPLARTGVSLGGTDIRSEVLLPCNIDVPHCELTEENGAAGYYLIPDKRKLRDLVAQLFYDPRVRLEAARVEVRTTGARAATASDVADRLEERSFRVTKRTDGAAATSAVLLRDRSKEHTARRLAEQLGLRVEVQAGEPADADIVVRLGSDFRGFASDRL